MIDYLCVLFVGDGVKRRPRRINRQCAGFVTHIVVRLVQTEIRI
jgi:hypothetical protein